MTHLALISCRGIEDDGDRILALAEWMGIPIGTIAVGESTTAEALALKVGERGCVAISLQSLATLRQWIAPEALRDLLTSRCAKLLVFAAGRAWPVADLLTWLTAGAVTTLASLEVQEGFDLPEQGRPLSRAFAGQSFAAVEAGPVPVFELAAADGTGFETLMRADRKPVFLRTQIGACEMLLLAVARLPRLDERLSRDAGIAAHYASLIPLLIALRHGFRDLCWHAPRTAAHLIIDDPLLRPDYGFLKFSALRDSMRATGYAASIAFIPWNHWRTSRQAARKLFEADPNLSICVHGCDHANQEFSEVDPEALQWMSDTALERMERHRGRTGLPYDAVMVFPQGNFSSAAMRALRTSGYVAAVNTTCFPTNADAEPLTIADVLRPAITRFDGFPLFQRHYPGRRIDFAFDAFVGRPLLIVQHHDDFREGARHQEAFVRDLYRMEPDLVWGPLTDQLTQSCMARRISDGAMEVRFFTREFRFRNAGDAATRLTLCKEESDTSRIDGVEVNGREVAFACRDGLLTFEHQAGPGESIHVAVRDKPRPPAGRSRRAPGIRHTVGVCVRRALSEFRDLTLARHPRLLAAAAEVAARLKVTGETGRKA